MKSHCLSLTEWYPDPSGCFAEGGLFQVGSLQASVHPTIWRDRGFCVFNLAACTWRGARSAGVRSGVRSCGGHRLVSEGLRSSRACVFSGDEFRMSYMTKWPCKNMANSYRLAAENSCMSIPLILLRVLAASCEVFEPQRGSSEFDRSRWPMPARGETLSQYAERFCRVADSRRDLCAGWSVVRRMLAQEMARFLNPQGLILIATVRGPANFRCMPRRGALCAGWFPGCPSPPAADNVGAGVPGSALAVSIPPNPRASFREADRELFRWSLNQIVRWPVPPVVTCRPGIFMETAIPVLPRVADFSRPFSFRRWACADTDSPPGCERFHCGVLVKD